MSKVVSVPLSQGQFAQISRCDAERVLAHKWCAYRAQNTKYETWYAQRVENGKTVYLHRFIMQPDSSDYVDHIDDNGLNNTRENLRICTPGQNTANARPRQSEFGFKGVYRLGGHNRRKPFAARIHVRGKRISLGVYETSEAAAAAYDDAALEHYGEFARLNFLGRLVGS